MQNWSFTRAKRLLKLFTESTFEGVGRGESMTKFAKRQRKNPGVPFVSQLYFLYYAKSEMRGPTVPLLVMLQLVDPNELFERPSCSLPPAQSGLESFRLFYPCEPAHPCKAALTAPTSTLYCSQWNTTPLQGMLIRQRINLDFVEPSSTKVPNQMPKTIWDRHR
jgi:hypothetical protein